jgi:hypothetical protein
MALAYQKKIGLSIHVIGCAHQDLNMTRQVLRDEFQWVMLLVVGRLKLHGQCSGKVQMMRKGTVDGQYSDIINKAIVRRGGLTILD